MELLLIKYGLVAVFLAAMLEADVIPVLAGVAAHRGYFDPVFAVATASFGALAGDCIWFYIGRSNTIRNSKLMRRFRSKGERLFRRVGNWQIPDSNCAAPADSVGHDDAPHLINWLLLSTPSQPLSKTRAKDFAWPPF